jgi:RTX calcium-binding nonapeptide repeat (4 copies)
VSLLTGFNISLDEVGLLGQASQAAFVGGNRPAGWTVVTPAQLGLGSQYWDGIYFTDPTSRASAIVLQQGSSYIVAFRGTDDPIDTLYYPELLTGTYIHHYDPLLNALSATAPSGAAFAFTGASLGGGATNLLANIASSAFSGRFAAATFVGFASPIIKTAAGILNLGFENDPIYKAINGYADFPSSLDNLVLATSQYMAGNYDGLHLLDYYAHSATLGFEALGRVAQSEFYDFMTPDSVLIFDANAGLVQDVTPGRENTGAFYLGENVADSIAGRNGNDFLEGFGGNDVLNGMAGDDALAGGDGNDWLYGGAGNDWLYDGAGSDIALYDAHLSERQLVSFSGNVAVLNLAAGETDRLVGIETIQFDDTAVAANSLAQFNGYDYLASYDDLIVAFGPNEMDAFGHYIYHGAFEGRQADAFDGYQYLATYDDLITAFGANERAAAFHFVSSGFEEGRTRDGFDGYQYLATYDDLITAFGANEQAAAFHFVNYGFEEGRTRDGFDGYQYIASYGDLIEAFGANERAGAFHFVNNGFAEGRVRDDFDAAQYLANYPDLQAAFGTDEAAATIHFINAGYFEGRTDHVLIV